MAAVGWRSGCLLGHVPPRGGGLVGTTEQGQQHLVVLSGWLNFSTACFDSISFSVSFSTSFFSLHSSMCCCRLSRDFLCAWMLLGMS